MDVNELNASVGKNEDVADGEMDSLEGIPEFKPIKTVPIGTGSQYRSVPVPPNRMSPLKKQWNEIFTPLVSHMNLQVRMNLKRRCVEIRGSPKTEDSGSVQKGADFVSAFISGFEIKDAIALLRLEDIYVESFDIKDGKLSIFPFLFANY